MTDPTPAPSAGSASAHKLALIGFMGAGKSTAARILGRPWADVDQVIEQRTGRKVVEIFGDDGEAAFRALEEQTTLELLQDPELEVISLGGGAVSNAAVRDALAKHARTLWLDVEVQHAWERVGAGGGSHRPLARDPRRFEELFSERRPLYEAAADVIVPATRVNQIRRIVQALDGLPLGCRMLWAATESADYPVFIGPGLITEHRFWPPIINGRRVLISDYHSGSRYADSFEDTFADIRIMPGEQSKTLAHAEIVWTEMVRHGVTRSDLVIALGGGVVGDLGGYCAAAYQRGMRYVQAPTTLVAQVDSAYGGKTAVDLAEAKNYVGAFHQPSAVIADTRTLKTLPPEELAAGYAEVVKTALITGGRLWDRVRGGAPPEDPQVIAGCALTKLRIVSQDEHDTGLRQLLNLGHTVGHAIETVTGYARYRHGEAVAIGLLAALRLSGSGSLREEVTELLLSQNLPVTLAPEVDVDEVIRATSKDKKRLGEGPVPFVLCPRPGACEFGQFVTPDELRLAITELQS